MPVVDRDMILKLHAEGHPNREIALGAGCHHNTVRKVLKDVGLRSNVLKGEPPERVDDKQSRCRECREVVPNEEFPFVKNFADGRRLAICRKCRYRRGRQAVASDPARYFADREGRMARGGRGARPSRQDISYSLPPGYLHGLWLYQVGLCFYTDRPMRMAYAAGRSPDGVSIDRVDPAAPYEVGNVVLCCSRVNSIKSDVTPDELADWMPGWHARVLNGLPDLVSSVQPIDDGVARGVGGKRLPQWVIERRARIARLTERENV
jgi:hypothetical protein